MSDLVKFAEANPSTLINVSAKPYRHPVLISSYCALEMPRLNIINSSRSERADDNGEPEERVGGRGGDVAGAGAGAERRQGGLFACNCHAVTCAGARLPKVDADAHAVDPGQLEPVHTPVAVRVCG